MAKNQLQDEQEKTSPPVWEWLVAAMGFIIVSVAIGMTLYRGAVQENSPPNIQISLKSVSQKSQGFLVEFELSNTGNRAASAVNVEGELKTNGETVETRTMTMAYAPSNSKRSGGLIFSKDPSIYDVEIRAVGFEDP